MPAATLSPRWPEMLMKTNRRANAAVGTTRKSIEAISRTWLSKEVRQVRAGGFRGRTMYFDTEACDTSIPSFSSSPWMRGALQSEFSRLTR